MKKFFSSQMLTLLWLGLLLFFFVMLAAIKASERQYDDRLENIYSNFPKTVDRNLDPKPMKASAKNRNFFLDQDQGLKIENEDFQGAETDQEICESSGEGDREAESETVGLAESETDLLGVEVSPSPSPSPSPVAVKRKAPAAPRKAPGQIAPGLVAEMPASYKKDKQGRLVCTRKDDKPAKSKQDKPTHIDMECCLDPDEIPNPHCYYPREKYGKLLDRYYNEKKDLFIERVKKND